MTRAMDWTGLPYFLAVARGGSLRAAAEELGSNHATVDRHLRALETGYGVRLFDRSKSGLRLTEAGEALMPEAEAAEQAVIGTRLKLQGLDRKPSGTVRLSIPAVFCEMFLAPILGQFLAEYPDIELETTVTNQYLDFARAETDVSVRVGYEMQGEALGRKIVTYHRGIYASQAYLDRYWATRGPGGAGLHWLGWDDGPEPRPDWVRKSPFPKAVLRHRNRGVGLILPLVQQGQGMSYLPVFTPAYFDGLVPVPGTTAEPDRSIFVMLHSDLRRTTRVRLLVEFLSDRLHEMKPLFVTGTA